MHKNSYDGNVGKFFSLCMSTFLFSFTCVSFLRYFYLNLSLSASVLYSSLYLHSLCVWLEYVRL